MADYHTLGNVYLFIVNIKPNRIISYSFPTAARVCDEIFFYSATFPQIHPRKMFLLTQQVSHCSTCSCLHQERIHTDINQFASHIHPRTSSQNFLPNPGQVRWETNQVLEKIHPGLVSMQSFGAGDFHGNSVYKQHQTA